MAKEKLFYTVQEIADMLGLHPSTISRLVRHPDPAQHLKAVVFGGSYRIRAKDWEEYLATHVTVPDTK